MTAAEQAATVPAEAREWLESLRGTEWVSTETDGPRRTWKVGVLAEQILAALDALVARCEKAERLSGNWKRRALDAEAELVAAEADAAQLRQALKKIAAYREHGDRNDTIIEGNALAKIARAALTATKEGAVT